MTDVAELLPLIRKNISVNFLGRRTPTNLGSNIVVRELNWLTLQSTTPSFRSRFLDEDAGPIDLVLVVDCIYHPSLLPALVETIDFLAVPGRTAVLVVVELRADDVVREFLNLWLNRGNWEVRRVGGLLKITYTMWVGWKT